ncbi:MAG: hypothetical protein HHJ15_18160 [Rhodoferax sp.]|uniref:hypothetical protein n=1 Tax=Rhodoferax sp. TaxID=50421 RepID=UPI00183D2647|nr:hypothetical protein [Rhodoferax sp.]NMM21847.1 hypothetical protein [Rhodoferax sp.]
MKSVTAWVCRLTKNARKAKYLYLKNIHLSMFEAFKVGVKISLISNASSILGLMATQLKSVDGHVAGVNKSYTELEKTIQRIKTHTLVGGALLGIGAAGIAVLKGPYEEAKKLAMAQANFQTLNLSALENSQAFGKAAAMSHSILGTTITGNVKLIHDLHTAFGDLHHAIGTSDMFAKMSIVAGVANGGKQVDGLVNAAAKALEHRGGKVINNPAEFASEANMMTQVMLGTKMRVSPMDYLTASGTGKMAYQMYDKEFLYGNYAGLMNINDGMRTGTAGMTAFSSLIGGHMDSKGKGFLADLGLYQEGFSKKRLGLMNQSMSGMSPEERRTAIASMGGQAVLSGGLSDKNSELFAHRPDKFIAEVLVPAIKQRFGMDLTDDQIALMVSKNFNRNTGDFLGTQITMASKLSKDTAIFGKSMGIGQAYNHYLKSPEGAEEAASAAWKNFLAVFGSVYLPTITKGLLKLAGVLDSLGKFVSEHSTLTKGFVIILGVLSAASVAGGAVILASAAFTALGTALSFVGGSVVLGALSTAFVAIGAVIGPVALGLAAIAATLGLLASVPTNNVKAGESDVHVGSLLDQALSPRKKMFETVRPGGNKPIEVTTKVNLDGREIAKNTTQHQSREMNRPQTGPRTSDPRMAPTPVGAQGSW